MLSRRGSWASLLSHLKGVGRGGKSWFLAFGFRLSLSGDSFVAYENPFITSRQLKSRISEEKKSYHHSGTLVMKCTQQSQGNPLTSGTSTPDPGHSMSTRGHPRVLRELSSLLTLHISVQLQTQHTHLGMCSHAHIGPCLSVCCSFSLTSLYCPWRGPSRLPDPCCSEGKNRSSDSSLSQGQPGLDLRTVLSKVKTLLELSRPTSRSEVFPRFLAPYGRPAETRVMPGPSGFLPSPVQGDKEVGFEASLLLQPCPRHSPPPASH